VNSIIFDMDGTIFDTERLMLSCCNEVAARFGMPEIDPVYPRCIGLDEPATMRILRDYFGDGCPLDALRAEAMRLFRERTDLSGPPVKPGARELLSYLHGHGCALALASSTAAETVRRELSLAGLLPFFDVVIGGDMIANGKPAPDIFLLACKKLGSVPAGTYVVEDSPNGVRAAFAAGTVPLMVPDMIEPADEIRGMCREVLPDLFAVREYLRALIP